LQRTQIGKIKGVFVFPFYQNQMTDYSSMATFDFLESFLFGSSCVMVGSAVLTFLGLSFFAAPYGKYSSSNGWGPMIPAQVAWCFMEIPNLWVVAIVLYLSFRASAPAISGEANKLALLCFVAHYINRSVIYPIRMRLSSCTPMPVSVMLAAFVFCSWNGLNQSLSLILVHDNPLKVSDPRCIAGFIIYLIGLYINITSDSILINAKKRSGQSVTGSGSKYVIPTGGMFTYVSCANYCKCSTFEPIYEMLSPMFLLHITNNLFSVTVGEIVEWWGFALMCGSLAGFSFALYSTAYLSSRAIHVSQLL
jgi:hypothetical protein